jgi:ParB family transcriptional regulator, chromosome partitioning protein
LRQNQLLALYRAGELNLEQMMAFTVSDDAAAQEAAWFDAPEWQRHAQQIRPRLIAAHVRADDRRAVFVTMDAYVAAGGGVIADLFQTRRYLSDPALLDRLAAEKLEGEAATVRAEGWKWVEIVSEIDWQILRGFEEVRGKRQPLSAKDAKKLGKLKRERDTLQRRDDLTDEEMVRHNELQGMVETLESSSIMFADRQGQGRSSASAPMARCRWCAPRASRRPEGEATGERRSRGRHA